jgi:hypothetical protein
MAERNGTGFQVEAEFRACDRRAGRIGPSQVMLAFPARPYLGNAGDVSHADEPVIHRLYLWTALPDQNSKHARDGAGVVSQAHPASVRPAMVRGVFALHPSLDARSDCLRVEAQHPYMPH